MDYDSEKKNALASIKQLIKKNNLHLIILCGN